MAFQYVEGLSSYLPIFNFNTNSRQVSGLTLQYVGALIFLSGPPVHTTDTSNYKFVMLLKRLWFISQLFAGLIYSVCPPVPPAHANTEYLLPWIGLWGPYRSHNQGPFSNYLSNAMIPLYLGTSCESGSKT